MRTWIWARRVAKEILRDPLSLIFGIGFPVVLLLLFSAIQSNIPVALFEAETLTPGIAVFGLSFLALFSAQLLARDRATFVLGRMFTTPMRAHNFILGYVLPLLPMALGQGIIVYGVSMLLGLTPTWGILPALASLLPVAGIYIGIGLLCGSLMSEKAATSLCGALLTNCSALLGGAWFSLEMVGEGFRAFADLLPFSHAVDLGRAALALDASRAEHLIWVCVYAVLLLGGAILAFRRTMRH